MELRASHEKMIKAVLEKARRCCPDGLDLLGVYGSAATGDMHEKSDLDLLIVPSAEEAGRQLARTFILDDEQVGYDLYCTSWEALEDDAECGHSQLGKLMDSVIVYEKDGSVRERLEALRSRASGILASDERFGKAREASERMRMPYADALLSGTMAEKRAYAAYVISLSLDAVMLYNGRYFRRGTKRTFEELEGLSLPEGFRDAVYAVIQAGNGETIDAALTRLVRSVLSFAGTEEQRPVPDGESLRGTYEEMVSNWRNKMTEAAENRDEFSSFMNMASLQFMLAGIAGSLDIPEFHVMKDFRADDLIGNAKAFDGILEEYLLEYEKAGMKPLIYRNADEFVRDYLGEN